MKASRMLFIDGPEHGVSRPAPDGEPPEHWVVPAAYLMTPTMYDNHTDMQRLPIMPTNEYRLMRITPAGTALYVHVGIRETAAEIEFMEMQKHHARRLQP